VATSQKKELSGQTFDDELDLADSALDSDVAQRYITRCRGGVRRTH
jgi:hypothetical protein